MGEYEGYVGFPARFWRKAKGYVPPLALLDVLPRFTFVSIFGVFALCAAHIRCTRLSMQRRTCTRARVWHAQGTRIARAGHAHAHMTVHAHAHAHAPCCGLCTSASSDTSSSLAVSTPPNSVTTRTHQGGTYTHHPHTHHPHRWVLWKIAVYAHVHTYIRITRTGGYCGRLRYTGSMTTTSAQRPNLRGPPIVRGRSRPSSQGPVAMAQ